MDDKKSEKPKDDEPKAKESQSPKAGKTDNDVVNAQSAGKDEVSKKAADGAGAPKDGEKSGDDAGDAYDLTTFLHLSEVAPDQSYAFGLWAEHKRWGKLSLQDWSKRYQDFLKRKV